MGDGLMPRLMDTLIVVGLMSLKVAVLLWTLQPTPH
jgi:hypothetical protein